MGCSHEKATGGQLGCEQKGLQGAQNNDPKIVRICLARRASAARGACARMPGEAGGG
jgi:hypothetical protein